VRGAGDLAGVLRTGTVGESECERLVRELFPLSPRGIIDYLDLRRPIYRQTASYGHFGRDDQDFSWESTRRMAELREAAGRHGVEATAGVA